MLAPECSRCAQNNSSIDEKPKPIAQTTFRRAIKLQITETSPRARVSRKAVCGPETTPLVCLFHNSLINIHILPLQNKKRDLNKAESVIPGSNGRVTTTSTHDMMSSDDMEETEECLDMMRENSCVIVSSPTPLLVVEESKYARVEAVRGPRPPPSLDQRVEYEMIDLKATKVS